MFVDTFLTRVAMMLWRTSFSFVFFRLLVGWYFCPSRISVFEGYVWLLFLNIFGRLFKEFREWYELFLSNRVSEPTLFHASDKCDEDYVWGTLFFFHWIALRNCKAIHHVLIPLRGGKNTFLLLLAANCRVNSQCNWRKEWMDPGESPLYQLFTPFFKVMEKTL